MHNAWGLWCLCSKTLSMGFVSFTSDYQWKHFLLASCPKRYLKWNKTLQANDEGRKRGQIRRLVLTAESLLERRPSTYEVAERRSLGILAALVRFSDQPQWLGLEWTDGAPPTMYITTAREAILTAILDAAQASLCVCVCHGWKSGTWLFAFHELTLSLSADRSQLSSDIQKKPSW